MYSSFTISLGDSIKHETGDPKTCAFESSFGGTAL